MKYPAFLMCSALFALAGCEQVTKLDSESGGSTALPPEVATVIMESCNGQPGCHADGAGGVTLDLAGAFVGASQGIAIPGDTENSRMIVRIQEQTMPPAGTLTLSEQGRLVLTGWIAEGAPLVEGEGSAATGDSGTAGDDDMGDSSGGEVPVPDYVEFVPVLEIFEANCGGGGCHRDGGPVPPSLEDNVAYDNIVDAMGNSGALYVEPNNADGSLIMHRITASMGTTIMPPSPGEPLAQSDIDTIADWINDGANL